MRLPRKRAPGSGYDFVHKRLKRLFAIRHADRAQWNLCQSAHVWVCEWLKQKTIFLLTPFTESRDFVTVIKLCWIFCFAKIALIRTFACSVIMYTHYAPTCMHPNDRTCRRTLRCIAYKPHGMFSANSKLFGIVVVVVVVSLKGEKSPTTPNNHPGRSYYIILVETERALGTCCT